MNIKLRKILNRIIEERKYNIGWSAIRKLVLPGRGTFRYVKVSPVSLGVFTGGDRILQLCRTGDMHGAVANTARESQSA